LADVLDPIVATPEIEMTGAGGRLGSSETTRTNSAARGRSSERNSSASARLKNYCRAADTHGRQPNRR